MLVACLVMGTASARDRVVIDYSDVDVTTQGGAQQLYHRIVNASEEVCRRDSVAGLNGYAIWRRCVHETVSRTVADVRLYPYLATTK